MRQWIKGALRMHHKGSLHGTLRRWKILRKGAKITPAVLNKGERRARRRGATHTLRQINLARTLMKVRRRGR